MPGVPLSPQLPVLSGLCRWPWCSGHRLLSQPRSLPGPCWCRRHGLAPGAAPVPAPRRRRRKRRDSIAPRLQLPPCLYGRGIPTGGCCEGTECAGLQEDQGLEETAIVGQPTPWLWQGQRLSRARRGARGEVGVDAHSSPLPCWWAPLSWSRAVHWQLGH